MFAGGFSGFFFLPVFVRLFPEKYPESWLGLRRRILPGMERDVDRNGKPEWASNRKSIPGHESSKGAGFDRHSMLNRWIRVVTSGWELSRTMDDA